MYGVLGMLDRLPFSLRARAEFEEVGSKPVSEIGADSWSTGLDQIHTYYGRTHVVNTY